MNVDNKKYKISVCTLFKNESRYLKEWIEYHRLIGIDHFYLYNTSNSHEHERILKKYLDDRLVTLINWPTLKTNESEDITMLGSTIPAYENVIKMYAAKETQWLVFIDVDEFLLPISGNHLKEIVDQYNDFPAIVLPEAYLDASDSLFSGEKQLVIESKKRVSFSRVPKISKMVFKPDNYVCFKWPPYEFIFKGNKEPVKLLDRGIKINHYLDRKMKSRYAQNPILKIDHYMPEGDIKMLLDSGYTIEESNMERFVDPLKKVMGFFNEN